MPDAADLAAPGLLISKSDAARLPRLERQGADRLGNAQTGWQQSYQPACVAVGSSVRPSAPDQLSAANPPPGEGLSDTSPRAPASRTEWGTGDVGRLTGS